MTYASLARTAARALAPPLRRTAALAPRPYSGSPASLGGATPPLAPFRRIPVESEKLTEQQDAIWDDGVAPEVTLDFDCQHIDTWTGLAMWLGGLTFFATLFQVVKLTDPHSKNPAVNRAANQVGVTPYADTMGKWKELKGDDM